MNIHIEYCEKWNYHPDFVRVTKLIEKYSNTSNIKSNTSPPRSGAFEVIINQKLVFSKLKTKKFPTSDDVKKWF